MPPTGSLVQALVKTFYAATVCFHNFSYVTDLGKLGFQLIYGGQNGTCAGDFSIGIAYNISSTIVAVLN